MVENGYREVAPVIIWVLVLSSFASGILPQRAHAQEARTLYVRRGASSGCNQYKPEQCLNPATRQKMEKLKGERLSRERMEEADRVARAEQTKIREKEYQQKVTEEKLRIGLAPQRAAEADRIARMKIAADKARLVGKFAQCGKGRPACGAQE